MTELLKQPQYAPLPVEQQVVQLLAGNEGVLRPIPVSKVKAFADDLATHFTSDKPTSSLRSSTLGTLKKENLKARIEAIKAFQATWAA